MGGFRLKFKDQLQFVWRNMKKNKLRVFMTIFATTIGCAFLIILASVGFGLQKSITDEILSRQIITEISIHGKKDKKEISEEDLKYLKQSSEIKAVIMRKYWSAHTEAFFENRIGNVQAVTTNMEEEMKAQAELAEGRLPKNKTEVVIGHNFAKSLLTAEEKQVIENEPDKKVAGYEGKLLNKSIILKIKDEKGEVKKEYNFTVVGVLKAPSRDWMEDNRIYMNAETENEINELFKEHGKQNELFHPEIKVYAKSFETVASTTKMLKEKGYHVYSVSEEIEQVDTFFLIVKIGLIFVGTIAVLIASIGIFNTMTMAVTERTSEIGIMKAIGTNPAIIRRMFVMESVIIGLVGSLLAIFISYLISLGVNELIPILLKEFAKTEAPKGFIFSMIPPFLIVISVSISIIIAIFSGLRPAIKATNINVLSAIRREM